MAIQDPWLSASGVRNLGSVVAIRAEGVCDITAEFPTVRDLRETANPAASLAGAKGAFLCRLDDVIANAPPAGETPRSRFYLLPSICRR
jgi:hypothetical protein